MATTTILFRQAKIAQAKPQVISPDQLIGYLFNICESRFRAYSYYPNSVKNDKWQAIQEIRFLLNDAKYCLNWKDKLKICLRTELCFHTIADRRTQKSFEQYMYKVNCLMNGCREALNYQKQY